MQPPFDINPFACVYGVWLMDFKYLNTPCMSTSKVVEIVVVMVFDE
jgi:hypothetical protein